MAILDTIDLKSKVLEILGGNPTLPYSIIGSAVGVTRERVRQIAQQNGYPPRIRILKPRKICPICGKAFYTRNLYCSPVCGYKSRQKRIVVNCYHCGKPIERTPGTMRSKSGKYYCNRLCLGKWTGENYSTKTKDRQPLMDDFEYEVGSRDEFPLKGRALSPVVTEIYNALLRSNENELIKVWNSNRAKLRALETEIKRKARKKGVNVASAIRDINSNLTLFLLRVTE